MVRKIHRVTHMGVRQVADTARDNLKSSSRKKELRQRRNPQRRLPQL